MEEIYIASSKRIAKNMPKLPTATRLPERSDAMSVRKEKMRGSERDSTFKNSTRNLSILRRGLFQHCSPEPVLAANEDLENATI